MGLRLANLDVSDWERTPSKRDPRLRREVRASRGILIRDIARFGCVTVASTKGVGSKWWKERYIDLFCTRLQIGFRRRKWEVLILFRKNCSEWMREACGDGGVEREVCSLSLSLFFDRVYWKACFLSLEKKNTETAFYLYLNKTELNSNKKIFNLNKKGYKAESLYLVLYVLYNI